MENEQNGALEMTRLAICPTATGMFLLFAQLLHLPTLDVAQGLSNGSIAADMRAILVEVGVDESEAENLARPFLLHGVESAESLLPSLRHAYTTLFSHPVESAIGVCESEFLYRASGKRGVRPNLSINPIAEDMGRRCRKFGLRVSPSFGEPYDHIAAELEFAALLSAYAAREDAAELRSEAIVEFEDFFKTHLGRWAKEFFKQCASQDASDFYGSLGLAALACFSAMDSFES